ncbi:MULTISPECIES: NUDIX hydrolase [Kribbella]|uniref:ADP-ribose pyrophosphatase YjhB (NUDIX family) n=1 Tax=Kribbella pratensis TaxID=2512112 RepID=A0ABY2FE97_9ACTN|nr:MULTISPECIES: NUDIX hydrolase [Kribbella]TDW89692.1 ADP-ribose pyrophosphatase YjhB (NUDIX family) [Kribbella pratensis]TDX08754.1 ADP-ribose pyrophosphatase YjhB (NUDIX family) [Kribbella sp. VKM Ac-2566]
MSRRVAAYAVCVEDGRVLLARYVSPYGDGSWWTLPGGGVEPCEDPFDTVTREVAEETGYESVVERLLGVDSRIVPAAVRRRPGPDDHQNIGIFYAVRITAGTTRPEPNGETAESVWTPIPEVPTLRRAALVDIGVALSESRPPTGHVPPVKAGGLIEY